MTQGMLGFLFMTDIRRFLRTVIVSNNLVYIDRWSFVHLLAGIGLAWLGFSLQTVVILLLAFEVWENYIQKNLFRRERFVDFVWDMITGIAGYLVFVNYII